MKLVNFVDFQGRNVSINPAFVTCVKEEINRDTTYTLVYVNPVNTALLISTDSYDDVIDKLKQGIG